MCRAGWSCWKPTLPSAKVMASEKEVKWSAALWVGSSSVGGQICTFLRCWWIIFMDTTGIKARLRRMSSCGHVCRVCLVHDLANMTKVPLALSAAASCHLRCRLITVLHDIYDYESLSNVPHCATPHYSAHVLYCSLLPVFTLASCVCSVSTKNFAPLSHSLFSHPEKNPDHYK